MAPGFRQLDLPSRLASKPIALVLVALSGVLKILFSLNGGPFTVVLGALASVPLPFP